MKIYYLIINSLIFSLDNKIILKHIPLKKNVIKKKIFKEKKLFIQLLIIINSISSLGFLLLNIHCIGFFFNKLWFFSDTINLSNLKIMVYFLSIMNLYIIINIIVNKSNYFKRQFKSLKYLLQLLKLFQILFFLTGAIFLYINYNNHIKFNKFMIIAMIFFKIFEILSLI